ncbi:hypothetical protein ES288_A12G032700v1 [Gossypium darwinii]|uniref:Uncharacterized protein n=2 Tax=Gossypium TaxID=3633 RepID=A0A5D2E5P2_GOSDA|nr:hypothetical protein ES288_A12G032700v1 [Gossypium darwinii]
MADGAQMASRSHPQKPRPRRLGRPIPFRLFLSKKGLKSYVIWFFLKKRNKMKLKRGRNENTTPFDPSPNHCNFEIYGLSSVPFQVRRPIGVVIRGARCGVVREGRTEGHWRLYEGWLRRI